MTLCPVAIAVGCQKCPMFSVCPLKSIIGNHIADKDAVATGGKPRASETKSKS